MNTLTAFSTGYICAYLNLNDTLRFSMISRSINLKVKATIHIISSNDCATLIGIIETCYRIGSLVGAKINESVCVILEFLYF